MTPSAPERPLKGLLRILAVVFALFSLVNFLGPLFGPFKAAFKHLPFVANTAAEGALFMTLCLYAAYNLKLRLDLVRVLLLGNILVVVVLLLYLFLGETGEATFWLWGGVSFHALVGFLLVIFYGRAAQAAPEASKPEALSTRAERHMQTVLKVLGVLFALTVLDYALGPLFGFSRSLFVELPFTASSAGKVGAMAALCFYIAGDVRRNLSVISLIVFSFSISLVAQLLFVAFADTSGAVLLGGRSVDLGVILWTLLLTDAFMVVFLSVVYLGAWKARYGLRFFRPIEYRTLIALSEVIVRGKEETVPPEDIAANVERYVYRIDSRRRWVQRVALFSMYLHPLMYLKPPFSELDEATRLTHLKRHFYRDVLGKLPDWWRQMMQAMIRVAKQLTFVGYYNDPRTYDSIGYVPFSKRDRARTLESPASTPHPLKVDLPADIDTEVIETDVCIVGSGAGGSVLAHELAKQGREVLIVERGKYVEPRHFTEDEVDMIGKLYADGIFQQTRDFRFTVLQGSCVGGTTVVNNAVCFPPPEHVVDYWNDPAHFNAGLIKNDLQDSLDAVTQLVSIQSQATAPLNPSYPKFLDEAQKPERDLQTAPVNANIEGCIGCGYCNIGCAYGKKMSMLDIVLPKAQREFPDKVRILAQCEVNRIKEKDGNPRHITELQATLGDGRKVKIRAKTVVLSAGAVASPFLLLNSKIGRNLPVGKHASFNIGAPLTAEFEDKMNAYDGLQISHFGLPKQLEKDGYVYETWWNPPVSQAINMPGWFEKHYHNMERYPYMMGVGILVGSKSNAEIKKALTGGADIEYKPDPEDMQKLAKGMHKLGEILFDAGAKRVLINTWQDHDYSRDQKDDFFKDLAKITADPKLMTLGTGHPMGGAALSQDPKRGVVAADFRVHGYDNLYVCDASVFPGSVQVNPQMTVMMLAHYLAARLR